MSIPDREHNRNEIIPRNRAEREESIFGAGPAPTRLVSTWASRIFMVFMIVAAVAALTHFACQVRRQDQNLAEAAEPGAGVVIRSEVVDIWLPPILNDLVKHQSQSEVIRSHEKLRRFLELRGQQNLWYAVTTRCHQVDGGVADVSFVRWPYREPNSISELMLILAKAASSSSGAAADDFSMTSVHILPEELAKHDPREVMAELLGHPHATVE